MGEVEYYKTLCALQKKTLENCWKFIHAINRPTDLDSASAREWSLGSQLLYCRKDNDALRELVEEYRERLHGVTN